MSSLNDLTTAAEAAWLARWTTGPTDGESRLPASGVAAPVLILTDHAGRDRSLAEFWTGAPALLMFWRHFGCGCGVDRARRLVAEWEQYMQAGLNPVIVGQGEPERAAAYRDEHRLACPILCDPDLVAYRAYGVGHWRVEQLLFDTPEEYWSHPCDLGTSLQASRRRQGRPLVDDPWRATAEFVIAPGGIIRLAYSYQYCEDFPDPRVLTTAARLSRQTIG
jgi:peroxiredoxin